MKNFNFHCKKNVKYFYILIFTTVMFLFSVFINEHMEIAKYMELRRVLMNRSDSYTAIVQESINLTKAAIETHLNKYQVEDSGINNIIGPHKAGYPVRTIVASITGSGSSYLREVFEFGLPTFYAIEKPAGKKEFQKDILYDIRNILTCQLEKSRQFHENIRYSTAHFGINPITTICKQKLKLCHNADYASTICRLYPFHVTKVLRVPLRKLKNLIHDKSLYIRLLLVVRDPRAIIASRHRLIWCLNNPMSCDDVTSLCNRMLQDYRYAKYLNWAYPQRVSFMRYEDLVEDITNTMVELFRWYGVQMPDSMQKTASMAAKPDASGKNMYIFSEIKTAQKPFQWKEEIDHKLVDNIEVACEDVMAAYGYRMTSNSSDLLDPSWRPVEEYSLNPDKYHMFIMSKEL